MQEFKMRGLNHYGEPTNVVVYVDAESEKEAQEKIQKQVQWRTWPEVSKFVFVKSK